MNCTKCGRCIDKRFFIFGVCDECLQQDNFTFSLTLPPEPDKVGPGWHSHTDTPILMWDGPIDFAAIPDDPHEARKMLSAKLQTVGDEFWAAMKRMKGWDDL